MENSTLEINVAQLLKSTQGASRIYTIEDEVDDELGANPVAGEVKLTLADRRILAQGRLTISLTLQCGRCLKPFICSIPLEIEEEYYPVVDIHTGEKLPPPDESGSFTIDEHHILDLTEAVRQYRVMASPMKPLCKEECAGICPACGKDLNEGPCDCPTGTIDPRWAELLNLKRKNAPRRDEGRK